MKEGFNTAKVNHEVVVHRVDCERKIESIKYPAEFVRFNTHRSRSNQSYKPEHGDLKSESQGVSMGYSSKRDSQRPCRQSNRADIAYSICMFEGSKRQTTLRRTKGQRLQKHDPLQMKLTV